MMNPKKNISVRANSAKAKQLLHSGENHIFLILAFIAAVGFAAVPLIITFMLSHFIEDMILVAIMIVMEALVVLPVFLGIYRMAGLACRKECFGIIDIFYPFTSIKMYLRSILLSVINILRISTPISVGFILASVIIFCLKMTSLTYFVTAIIGGAVGFIGALALIPLSFKFYALTYLVVTEEMSVPAAICRSFRMTRGRLWQIVIQRIRIIPLTMISIATICLPLTLYTFPYLVCQYSVSCLRLAKHDTYDLLLNDIAPAESSAGVEDINE